MNCQDYFASQHHPRDVTRRWFFQQCGVKTGPRPPLAHLFAESGVRLRRSDGSEVPHFAPKAKHVIFLFMARCAEPSGTVRP